MDRAYVMENDVVGRYVRGELAGEERAAFEAFYLDDQETLDELELLAAMLPAGSSGQPVAPAGAERPRPPGPRPPAGPTVPRRWMLPLCAAAMLAVGFFLGTLTGQPPRAAPAAGAVALLDVATLRSQEALTLSLPADVRYAAFRVAVGPVEGAVDVRLLKAGETVATASSLVPDGYGEVLFALPADTLAAGAYRFLATEAGATETVLELPVRLVR